MDDLWMFLVFGFAAQMVDGALGMGYGVSLSSLLLARGLPPGIVSASVHASECFTTGVSGFMHRAFGNVDRTLFWRLLIPGVLGAIAGAYILANIPGDKIKPYVAGYLMLMGLLILAKAIWAARPAVVRTYVRPLGFVGAFVDMIGGGGWGPICASTLIARGNNTRTTIGTVNAVEFFVTIAGSVTFLLTLGIHEHWRMILALAGGGMIAAPMSAWVCRHAPHRALLVLVGLLVVILAGRTLYKVFV